MHWLELAYHNQQIFRPIQHLSETKYYLLYVYGSVYDFTLMKGSKNNSLICLFFWPSGAPTPSPPRYTQCEIRARLTHALAKGRGNSQCLNASSLIDFQVSMVRSSMALRDSFSRDLFSDMWIAMEDGASPLSSSSCYTYVRTIHTLDGSKIDLFFGGKTSRD
jgi:hypothetical protein